MRHLEHLQLRRGRWFVRLRVPAHLIAKVGQTHVVRSLETAEESVAKERRWIALAELWRWIGAQTVSDGWSPAWAAPETVFSDAHHDSEPTAFRPKRSRPTKAPQDDHLTVAEVMQRWLTESEGLRLLSGSPRGAS